MALTGKKPGIDQIREILGIFGVMLVFFVDAVAIFFQITDRKAFPFAPSTISFPKELRDRATNFLETKRWMLPRGRCSGKIERHACHHNGLEKIVERLRELLLNARPQLGDC